MNSLILLVSFVACSQAIPYDVLVREQWENFKIEHGKYYKSETEEQYRQNIYMENIHQITEHNKLYQMGIESYKMEINEFGDLSEDEFLRLYTMTEPEEEDESALYPLLDQSMEDFVIYAPPFEGNLSDLPGEFNWVAKGAVTEVKKQGHCGSCYSFSATGSLEGQWYRKTNKLISLSEQNIIDCSTKYKNNGCHGGRADKAFRYIIENKGIDTEESYPYKAKKNNCRYKFKNKGASVSKFVMVSKSEKELKKHVGTIGPMSISITVGPKLRFYRNGVYDNAHCNRKLGHAVLAVGYGSLNGTDYWLVKNSWGKNWGDNGYIKMARNKDNQCGIASRISYPII